MKIIQNSLIFHLQMTMLCSVSWQIFRFLCTRLSWTIREWILYWEWTSHVIVEVVISRAGVTMYVYSILLLTIDHVCLEIIRVHTECVKAHVPLVYFSWAIETTFDVKSWLPIVQLHHTYNVIIFQKGRPWLNWHSSFTTNVYKLDAFACEGSYLTSSSKVPLSLWIGSGLWNFPTI